MTDNNFDSLPANFAHIEPVYGDISEIWFDTVESRLYGLVREVCEFGQLTLCYGARACGYELLWTFRALGGVSKLEILGSDDADVIEVAEDEGNGMLMVIQDIDGLRVVMIFRFDRSADEWVLHLVLHVDLAATVVWGLPRVDVARESATSSGL
jgi:hypothetical protein